MFYSQVEGYCLKDSDVHRYNITFKGVIAICEGPIACLMFAQFLETNNSPCTFPNCPSLMEEVGLSQDEVPNKMGW
jgi:hypothetical protein